MTKRRSTKSALISSVLALVLCCSMLLGTTFAWFTDSVTSSGNKIVAGSLKIDLELLDATTGNWTSIKESKAPIFNYENWEPGYVDLKILKIENEGTLALKWKAKLVSTEGLSELADVLDVYILSSETELSYPTDRSSLDGYTKVGTLSEFVNSIESVVNGELTAKETATSVEYLGIAFKMQESAGNKYQEMALGLFDIQIVATQLASENDSFNNQYDAGAEYDGEITNPDGFAAAMAAGGTFKVMNDVVLNQAAVVGTEDVTIDLNGKTITAGADGYILENNNGATVILKDSMAPSSSVVYARRALPAGGEMKGAIANGPEGTMIVESGTFTAVKTYVFLNEGGSLTFNGGTINGGSSYPIYSYTAKNNEGTHTLVINDVTVNGVFGAINAYYKGTVEINGGTFTMTGIEGSTSHIAYFSTDTVVTINGGSFAHVGDVSLSGEGGGGICVASNAQVTINGGSFAGDYADLYNWGNANSSLTVKGGTFKFNPQKFVVSGYQAVEDKEAGFWFLLRGDTVETVADGLYYNAVDTYYISNANGLTEVANMVNSATPYTTTPFDDKTVLLVCDIDLGGAEWIPIGDDRSQRTEFHGVFDGQGYTISNFKITKKTDRDDENKSSYGLFGNVKGTIKNLTVSDATISGAPKFIGILVGRLNDGLIENCHVTNSSATCNNWTIGALVGQYNNGKISGCTVTDTTVTGYAAVGGIAGVALNSGERVIENCTVEGCMFVKNGNFGGDFDEMFGAILGALYSGELTVNMSNCVAINNNINELCGHVSEGDKLNVDGYAFVSDGLFQNGVSYRVTNANGLEAINKKMADKSAGKDAVVNLLADIDFTGKVWTPVDGHYEFGFSLKEFNGNGHTISNLTINGQAMFTRFVNYQTTVTVKDVTFDKANVNSNGQINTAIVVLQTYSNLLLDNVDVKNSTITGGYKVAVLIGTVYNESDSTVTATVKNCDIDNCVVKSTSYDFGTCGFIGWVAEGNNDYVVFENSTISNTTLCTTSPYYTLHAFLYYNGEDEPGCINEAEGVTVTNCVFEKLA